MKRLLLIITATIFLTSVGYSQTYKEYENLASSSIFVGNYQDGIHYSTLAIQLDSDNEHAYYAFELRARAHLELGNILEALEDYSRAILHGSKSFTKRGQIRMDLGQYQLAVVDFTEGINVNPTKDLTHYDRIPIGRNQHGEMRFVTNRSIFDYDRPHFNRGISYFKLQEFVKAIEDFTKIIDLTPIAVSDHYESALHYRGLSKIELGLQSDGCTDLSNASILGLRESTIMFNRNCR